MRRRFNDQSGAEFRVADFHAFRLIIRHADVEILVQLGVPDDSHVGDVKNAEIALRTGRNGREGEEKCNELDPTTDSKRRCNDCAVVLWAEFSIGLCSKVTIEDEFRGRDASSRRPCERHRPS